MGNLTRVTDASFLHPSNVRGATRIVLLCAALAVPAPLLAQSTVTLDDAMIGALERAQWAAW
jgi:hypothetical protein